MSMLTKQQSEALRDVTFGFDYARRLDVAVERIVAAHLVEQREQIVQEIRDGRDSFLSSDNLDPAWIAGWHSATDHHAHRITKGGK